MEVSTVYYVGMCDLPHACIYACIYIKNKIYIISTISMQGIFINILCPLHPSLIFFVHDGTQPNQTTSGKSVSRFEIFSNISTGIIVNFLNLILFEHIILSHSFGME
jgi:ribosomal protein L31